MHSHAERWEREIGLIAWRRSTSGSAVHFNWRFDMSRKFNSKSILHITLILGAFLLSSCGSDDITGGGGGCDLVGNAQEESFFQVTNNLSSGLQWIIRDYAFGGDMKPGECNQFGVTNGTYTVRLTQCNIGDAACTSTFGATVSQMFTVASGETYSITVTSALFQ